uniref:Uncharacterized protein n=1 Tax=Timema shepardi TaxID=629360 RepID=A0A7R9B0Q6_TIMSH|nr:unnamed protein product [Timema shepardi]
MAVLKNVIFSSSKIHNISKHIFLYVDKSHIITSKKGRSLALTDYIIFLYYKLSRSGALHNKYFFANVECANMELFEIEQKPITPKSPLLRLPNISSAGGGD